MSDTQEEEANVSIKRFDLDLDFLYLTPHSVKGFDNGKVVTGEGLTVVFYQG